MMKIILLDLDNTIADDSWRIGHINWNTTDPFWRYHDYHSLSAFDPVGNQHILNIEGTMQIIMTARPKAYEAVTREWLMRNKIKWAMLFMRPDNNYDDSVVLKKSFLDALVNLHGLSKSRMVAYDDRLPVVEMYKENGVKAELIRIHQTCSYKRPTQKGKTK